MVLAAFVVGVMRAAERLDDRLVGNLPRAVSSGVVDSTAASSAASATRASPPAEFATRSNTSSAITG